MYAISIEQGAAADQITSIGNKKYGGCGKLFKWIMPK
jgi:hypothetical protein